jgi:dsDNA-specific endonuclease/ATPase MutS2
VIARANELLDSETRQMGDLIRDLEDQKALIDERVEELEKKQNEMKAIEQKMKEKQDKLERKMLTARRDEAKKFAKTLEEKEAILEDVLERLKSDPSKKLLAKSWDDIRFVKRDAISEAENVPSVLRAKEIAKETLQEAQAELVPLAEMRQRPELKEGDELIVCKIGPLFQRQAIVEKILGRRVQVKVSGVTMAMKLTDVAIKPANVAIKPSVSTSSFGVKKTSKGSKLSKAAEKALKSEMEKAPASIDPAKPKEAIVIRTESNTVDVRGCNFEEAKDRIRTKISKAIMNQRRTIFVLHGHGTGGVLKTKLRRWFQSEKKLVKQWGAAEQSDGGDAFSRLDFS